MFDDCSILITGGTGSFGKKCAAILTKEYRPRRVIIYSRDEFKQFELSQKLTDPAMRFFLGDVRDCLALTPPSEEWTM